MVTPVNGSVVLIDAYLRRHFDVLADYYHLSPAPTYYWFRKRQKVLSLIERNIERLPAVGPISVIDLGCGDGVDLFLIRRKLHEYPHLAHRLKCIGLEADPGFLEVSRLKAQHYGTTGTSFQFCNFAVGSLPFDDQSVDFVYCSEVLEHLHDPDTLLFEIHRIVKPGGVALFTSPNEPNILQRSWWSKRALERHLQYGLNNPCGTANDGTLLYGHISVRTISEWERALKRRGFNLVDCARGAITYGYRPINRRTPIFALQLLGESILDILPVRWSRRLSDQWIGLYQKRPCE